MPDTKKGRLGSDNAAPPGRPPVLRVSLVLSRSLSRHVLLAACTGQPRAVELLDELDVHHPPIADGNGEATESFRFQPRQDVEHEAGLTGGHPFRYLHHSATFVCGRVHRSSPAA